MSRGAIARADNLFDFFLVSIDEAASRRSSPVSEEGRFYLTQLLVERGRVREGPVDEPDTLAELYERAQHGPSSHRLSAWRELADRALYVTGFFRQSLSRRLVSLEYYFQMGSAAYHRLSRLVCGPRSEVRGLDEVWAELGHKFEDASDLLLDVHEDLRASEVATDQDVLRLYEAWLETGSPRLLARLQALGVAPTRPREDEGS